MRNWGSSFKEDMKQALSFYKKIFTSASVGMVVCDESGQCVEANDAMGKIIGGERKDILSQNYYNMKSWEGTDLLETILYAAGTKKNQNKEISFTTSFGRSVTLDFHILPFEEVGRDYLLTIVYDITKRKQAEEELNKHRNHLRELVVNRTTELEQKTLHLEEYNVALKVLLQQREEDKKQIEEKMLHNVEKLVLPYLEKLKTRMSQSEEYAYIEIMESNLREIILPFAPSLSGNLAKLTPTEIQIADLIRKGKTTKEIAKLLKLSPITISSHRQNIRKKLGLTNKKINLQTSLQQINSN
jgi:PAS domain S-box-containing protein